MENASFIQDIIHNNFNEMFLHKPYYYYCNYYNSLFNFTINIDYYTFSVIVTINYEL